MPELCLGHRRECYTALIALHWTGEITSHSETSTCSHQETPEIELQRININNVCVCYGWSDHILGKSKKKKQPRKTSVQRFKFTVWLNLTVSTVEKKKTLKIFYMTISKLNRAHFLSCVFPSDLLTCLVFKILRKR